MEINMCYLYPGLLNMHGDTGNCTILKHRMTQRGVKVNIYSHTLGDTFNGAEYDIVLMGSGQGFETDIVREDIKRFILADIKDYIESGGVFLAVGGGYQMLGEHYKPQRGESVPCLNILPFYTEEGEKYLTGNIAVKINDIICVGFENHTGKTNIGSLTPLGEVIKGYGNGFDNGEGVRYKNTFCTYLHGPFLSKNPEIADIIITAAFKGKGYNTSLTPLDDAYEASAKRSVLAKMGI